MDSSSWRNRRAALDVLAANLETDLSIQLRSIAYRGIIADVRRTHAQVNRRTEQTRQMVMRHNAERQRVGNAERVASPRHTIAESERPHYDFKPLHSPENRAWHITSTQKEKIMALKRKDETLERNPTNYERDSRAAGINFPLSGSRQLFAPYSFLSPAQMNGEEEISFRYTFGMVRVKGEYLDFIYSMVRGHELGSINCATD